ncbi:MAG TPA: 5'/3'-nucleotidase SurE [Solirubrobacterales bacterium]|nr:5'/3'-nucleotidase SurE [Solirubrobacterales bacterium]
MRVLLTNDDGIGASGLHAARRELRKIEGIQLDVIAPDSNRSATARSITTRSPLSVEEIRFEDGDLGHATDGTPVDCVRFAEVGLLGERPDLIVSGINHGVNLGDDVTYSGTVAAAFEGIVLGIPAISASQQSSNGDLGYRPQREYDFDIAARFLADLVRQVIAEPMPPATLINVNVPGGRPSAVAVTKLGKRLYRDELEKVHEDENNGRRSYKIYGYEPGMDDEPGTDIGAIARGQIAITPLHLDLTDHEGIEALGRRDLDRALGDAVAAAP